jgi:hypothetical protein
MAYWIVNDNREPTLIHHSKICYPSIIYQDMVEKVDSSYPGIVMQWTDEIYYIQDGVHRIAKLQQNGIFESLFYVVTKEESYTGMLHLVDDDGNPSVFLDEENLCGPLSIEREDGKWTVTYNDRVVVHDALK